MEDLRSRLLERGVETVPSPYLPDNFLQVDSLSQDLAIHVLAELLLLNRLQMCNPIP